MQVPLLDLKGQYRPLRAEIETAIREVVNNVIGWSVAAALMGFLRDEKDEPRITGSKPPEGMPQVRLSSLSQTTTLSGEKA